MINQLVSSDNRNEIAQKGCWSLNRRNEEQLQVFERRILRKICDNGKWPIRYNSELYSIYTDPDIIKTIKVSKLRWTGHIMRMPEETQ